MVDMEVSMKTLASNAHIPSTPEEQTCNICGRPATTVIKGIPECDEHTGRRIIDGDNLEVLGALVAESLRCRN
jgi:hypothetical protein